MDENLLPSFFFEIFTSFFFIFFDLVPNVKLVTKYVGTPFLKKNVFVNADLSLWYQFLHRMIRNILANTPDRIFPYNESCQQF